MWVPLYKGASTGPIQQLPWEGPACWTGPLPFPYDAGRSALTDFSQDISKEVQENQTAFVIIHAADRECGPYSEASTVVGFLPRHEARKLAWMISRTQDRGREWTPAAKKASFRVVR